LIEDKSMVGLVLAAHAGLAAELLKAAEMIVGPLEKVAAVAVNSTDTVDGIRDAMASAIEATGGSGVLVMTDMFGGTPSNMSLSFLKEGEVEVLTGMNLPMLIKFASDRKRVGVTELAAQLKECGRESISVPGDYLR
jgi:PTS system mannose-specific IIA component